MKRITAVFESFSLEDAGHFLGTSVCLFFSKIAPILAVIALVYQIRVLRAKAKREEKKLKKECDE